MTLKTKFVLAAFKAAVVLTAALLCALIAMTAVVTVCVTFSLSPPYPWIALGVFAASVVVQLAVARVRNKYLGRFTSAGQV